MATFVVVAAAVGAAWTQGPGSRRADKETPEAWAERTRGALERQNLENAIYYYRSLVHVQGTEDLPLLSGVAELVLRSAMRREGRWIRLTSAESLARHGDAEALQVLRDTASGAQVDPALRNKALQLLGELQDRESIPMLQEFVFDATRSAQHRLSATEALLRMGDVTGSVDLVRTLEGGSVPERLRAADIAAEHRLSVRAPLRKVAAEEKGALRLHALRALALLGEADAIETLRSEFGTPGTSLPWLEPPPGAPPGEDGQPLVPEPDEAEVERLFFLAQVLLETGDRRGLEWLAALAANPAATSRRGSSAVLVAEADPEMGLPLLRQVLAEGMVMDRLLVAQELVRQGKAGEGVIEAMRFGYDSTRERGEDALRMQILVVLGDMRFDGIEDVLREALDDPSTAHRLAAARGLAAHGVVDGLRPLRRELESADRAQAMLSAAALLEAGRSSGAERGGSAAPASAPGARGTDHGGEISSAGD